MHAPTSVRLGLAILITLAASTARAQMLSDRGPPQHRVTHSHRLSGRLNPLGLLYEGRFSYRYRLYASDSVALRDNFVSIGLIPAVSPIFARVGVVAEVQPLTVFGVWASYEFMPYFGSMNLFQSFPGATSNFSDSAIKDLGRLPAGDPQRAYPTLGAMLTLAANLNLKFGPVVVRDQFRAYRPDFQMRGGDTTFYDQTTDLLMPNARFTLTNDLDVLVQTSFGLMVGARYSLGVPLYGPENGAADNSTHRLGPVVAYRFFDRDGAAFNQPTVALLVNWWLKHPYRTGVDVAQGIPYVALAFNFVGDLVPLPEAAPKPE